MRKYFFVLLLFLLLGCNKKTEAPIKQELYNWNFVYKNNSYLATVPGCIHTDLIKHNIIQHPFLKNYEDSVQWVSDSVWVYYTTFDRNIIHNFKNNKLVFEGLDTYAKIYVNNKRLNEFSSYDADNAFRRWEFDIPNNLKERDNELKIEFYPSKKIDSAEAAKLSYSLPDSRVFTRKPPYQSGWDWGPSLNTVGITKPVYLLSWDGFIIRDFQIHQNQISQDKAIIIVETEIHSDVNQEILMCYKIDNKTVNKTKTQVIEGKSVIKQKLEIENPKLWYPNGLGDQVLYNINVTAESYLAKDEAQTNIGLRTIELKTNTDSIGTEFTFYVNGEPIFIKGANYIPSDSFIPNRDPQQYNNLLQDAVDANMNMIRIWGGGIYEDDNFYGRCDELGLLVWQDFIFACALYPSDEKFLNNVKLEATEQIKRLRNHACLALWCGNNEVKNGWEDWGWQQNYTVDQRAEINESIQNLFNKILPDLVKKYDNNTTYIPTSPLWGWGHPESVTSGNAHYWGVWWGEEPFEIWDEKTGRFMAEYGFQSYPQLSTILKFADKEDLSFSSPVIKSHQKHERGYQIISKSINNYLYDLPENEEPNIENFIYLSQVVQAYGIAQAIESHRYKMPYCMGTLFWQLNDCWPCASWSSIDYYGNKKALYYIAKEKFKDIIIVPKQIEDTLNIYLVSDKKDTLLGNLEINIVDFFGNVLRSDVVKEVIVNPNSSVNSCKYILRDDFLAKKDSIFVNIKYKYKIEDKENENLDSIVENHILDYPKNLSLPKSNILMKVEELRGKYKITLSSEVYSKYVYISSNVEGDFDDNFFDMLPFSTKTVIFTPNTNNDKKVNFTVKNYNNVI
ncbi:MAG: glycosyl hydrolase 2 galactose-binding domain-containing protein [Bacteroidales bacterium]